MFCCFMVDIRMVEKFLNMKQECPELFSGRINASQSYNCLTGNIVKIIGIAESSAVIKMKNNF